MFKCTTTDCEPKEGKNCKPWQYFKEVLNLAKNAIAKSKFSGRTYFFTVTEFTDELQSREFPSSEAKI